MYNTMSCTRLGQDMYANLTSVRSLSVCTMVALTILHVMLTLVAIKILGGGGGGWDNVIINTSNSY